MRKKKKTTNDEEQIDPMESQRTYWWVQMEQKDSQNGNTS